MSKNYIERIEELKLKVKQICPTAKEQSGIYIMKREENGFKFAYVGQSVNVLKRLAEHLDGHEQHIDRSIKSHKLKSNENPCGWEFGCLYYPTNQLNAQEQYFIKLYANSGYQMLNKTSGSQNSDKFGISANSGGKGYREGVKYGEIKAIRQIKELFDKYLDYSIKEPLNKVKQRKLKEFEELLKGDSKNDKGTTD